jgi:hypothetical protein
MFERRNAFTAETQSTAFAKGALRILVFISACSKVYFKVFKRLTRLRRMNSFITEINIGAAMNAEFR